MTAVEVVVDRLRCAGAGQCARTLPEVFDQRPSDGRVLVLDPAPPAALLERLTDAEDGCPVQAIRLVRRAG
ncbi:ferredoxin [Kitasatospora viridis]|uniref:Ferredoxin n=1 Tax=Kitasatospora viridis TaxID=281105 RepID=A0A561UCE9_9ACTN|nr:ferredoxin [Kitasatospora viridis]TWF97033.1 ferredoxin [Kitasatospora viridis]